MDGRRCEGEVFAIGSGRTVETSRKLRQERLSAILEANPMTTDQELAASLGVSLGTVRLDRAMMAH